MCFIYSVQRRKYTEVARTRLGGECLYLHMYCATVLGDGVGKPLEKKASAVFESRRRRISAQLKDVHLESEVASLC